MWARILEFFKAIVAEIGHFFGQKPRIPSDVEVKPGEKVSQPDIEKLKKDLSLFQPSKYELIDWENNPPPYRKKDNILSFQERKFFYILVRVVSKNLQVFPMVRMADVIKLSRGIEDYKYHRNNILCKHFDFVICDNRKFEPLLVIELDDSKHKFINRRQADIFKEKACQEAGIELIRFDVKGQYNRDEIAAKIHQKLANSD